LSAERSALRFGCSPLVDPNLFRRFCDTHKEILPTCAVRPTQGDISHLADEIASGLVDAALVTLPLNHDDLHVEELRRDRLVVCLRRDDPLTKKQTLQTADLQGNLTVLYHPKCHPEAHTRLLELLADVGVKMEDYSHASHPVEMQMLVREGHGLSLVRDGTILDEQLTTRPIAGVDWTVDTAAVYHKQQHAKTIPVLIRKMKRQLSQPAMKDGHVNNRFPSKVSTIGKHSPQSDRSSPI